MAFKADGTKLIMNRGNYGIPIAVRVKSHCQCCAGDIVDTDEIVLQIHKGPQVLVRRAKTWKDLQDSDYIIPLELTKKESRQLPPGVYYWRVIWSRPGEICNTLLRSTLEVTV